jgi:cytochrome b561
MLERIDRSLDRFAAAGLRRRALTAIFGVFALITVAIGAVGLQGDSPLRRAIESSMNIHAVFGLFLCGVVLCRCQWCARRSRRMRRAGVRELSRHLSHLVYLFLFASIGIRQVVSILNHLSLGSPVEFWQPEALMSQGAHGALFNLKDDCQLFLASGVAALIFVRALTLAIWLRSIGVPERRTRAAARGIRLNAARDPRRARPE